MKNKGYLIQTLVLFAGSIFAWTTVYFDFMRFYNIYGTITKVSNCVIPNPVTTPCFYGAIAFVIGFLLSLNIFIKKIKGLEVIKIQKYLFYLLISGTLFAWTNFIIEAYKFYTSESVEKYSCSGIKTENVLLTPCFYGAVIFLISFLVNKYITKHQEIK